MIWTGSARVLSRKASPIRHRSARKVRLFIPMLFALSACVPASVPDVASRAQIASDTLPPMKIFANTPNIEAPQRSNADIARDFLDLSMKLESGRALPRFTRFEGPITVRVTGTKPPTLGPDLRMLVDRLRREAGINISLTAKSSANITIQAVSRRDIRRVLPQAACFVAPNVQSLKEYRQARRKSQTDWALLEARNKIAIFLPHDASPQEIRDCLHEELAQAIGPLNDLYRLSDSVFNDDNVHTVLTGFDMLILRTTYDPALKTGMTRRQVAAALPAILARINPQGQQRDNRRLSQTPRDWSVAIQTALGRAGAHHDRVNAAQHAVAVATRMGWTDHRRAFSHYALGRVLQANSPAAAYQHYRIADRRYAALPNADMHRAYVGTRLAAFDLQEGKSDAALARINTHLPAARRSENAALLASLLLLQAEALDQMGHRANARRVRLDSIGWARYGFGADWAVRAKLREIASLNPRKG